MERLCQHAGEGWGCQIAVCGGKIYDSLCALQALMVALSWGFVFSIVSAFSPGYYTLLLFRGMVGVGFSGGFLG